MGPVKKPKSPVLWIATAIDVISLQPMPLRKDSLLAYIRRFATLFAIGLALLVIILIVLSAVGLS